MHNFNWPLPFPTYMASELALTGGELPPPNLRGRTSRAPSLKHSLQSVVAQLPSGLVENAAHDELSGAAKEEASGTKVASI